MKMNAAPSLPSVPAPQEDAQRQVLLAFQGEIQALPVSIFYRLGLFCVALAMVLLPLVYIGLIVLAAYGVYYHATENVGILGAGGKRGGSGGGWGVLLIYLGPIIAGGILVLFMIKPFFAGRPRGEKPRALQPALEPLLFAFVETLCRTIGAPVPKEIRVDSRVNASASFRSGVWSLFTNDLVLTIGLPLAAGLNLRQLAGVLAHEFGHFSQQAGMRLTYLIQSINAWFARVVYERDAWDEALTQWSKEIDVRIGVVFYLARFCVWLTRRILQLLMLAGHGISCFMLRQMEYDADRYEAHLAGSEEFAVTMSRVTYLSIGSQWAHSDLQQSWQEGRLADDLPALISHKTGKIPEDAQRKIDQELQEVRTGFFDTHPSNRDRNAAARREQTAGIFRLDRPSAVLFSDFPLLCKVVTRDFYREVLGRKVKDQHIRPVGELLERQEKEQVEVLAVKRYFQRQVSPLRPLQLPALAFSAAADAGAAAKTLETARARMLELAPAYAQDLQDLEKLRAKQAREQFTARLEPLEGAARERLGAALQLLHDPDLERRLPEAPALRDEAGRLRPVLENLLGAWPALLDLRLAHSGLEKLLEELPQKQKDQNFIASLVERMHQVQRRWKAVLKALTEMPYPFEHGEGKISLQKYLVSKHPAPNDLGKTMEASAELLNKLFGLYLRVLGRLVLAAEQVEQAVGLPPLPDPPSEAEEPAKREAE